MQAKDILPDGMNHSEFNGVPVRKGTVGACLANARVCTDAKASPEAVADARRESDFLRQQSRDADAQRAGPQFVPNLARGVAQRAPGRLDGRAPRQRRAQAGARRAGLRRRPGLPGPRRG